MSDHCYRLDFSVHELSLLQMAFCRSRLTIERLVESKVYSVSDLDEHDALYDRLFNPEFIDDDERCSTTKPNFPNLPTPHRDTISP